MKYFFVLSTVLLCSSAGMRIGTETEKAAEAQTAASGLAMMVRPQPQPQPAELILPAGKAIKVAQYNILASYLGSNTEPWFLLGANISIARRGQMMNNYYTKGADGLWSNVFANGYGGILTDEEKILIEEYNDLNFKWENRGPRIISEVQSWGADVISFVEMDQYDAFKTQLSGYESTFMKRPRSSSPDGSTVFWKEDRFKLLGEPVKGAFKDYDPYKQATDEAEFTSSRTDRVFVAVALQDLLDDRVLVVISMHLMRNPEDEKKDMLRAMEANQMMAKVTCLMDEHGASGLVILGDFNASPQSWTHLMLLEGWQACTTNRINMTDAFDNVMWNRDFCTSKTDARSEWIDYILYSGSTITPTGPAQVRKCPEQSMPSPEFPSDHMPLVFDFQFAEGHHWGLCNAKQPYAEATDSIS